MNMDFPDVEFPDTSSGSLLRQFQSSVHEPIHPCIQEVIKRERRDPDKIILPRFMAKFYPLQDMAKVFPDSVPIDSFVASLDAVIWDSVDKKVDASLKKSYAGNHFALRAGIYGTYVAQSLLSDLKSLDGSSDCSGLMSLIERQVEFLSDISFDVVWASALAEGACVSAHRNLVLRDWKTDAAHRASALRLPFQGNLLFGAELEEKLNKLFKEKKHSSSFPSTLGDRYLFRRKSPVQAVFFRLGDSPFNNEGDEDGRTWG
ncbi:hypothetical protein NDU88_007624 [Pleurodeles waltl]|uniref:Lamina-associated polypeptide 2 alpha C-terminal domain-containing protein n=1 Tax=Pleurodeles waltl TaxID=8319 RepID=A0AAV7N6E7_PLEWA|nr:hypothetical protein NDU88_007624 [Pleurodeles waltl]